MSDLKYLSSVSGPGSYERETVETLLSGKETRQGKEKYSGGERCQVWALAFAWGVLTFPPMHTTTV